MSAPLIEARPALSATPCLDRQIPLPPRNSADSELRWWHFALIFAVLLVKTFFVLFTSYVLVVLVHELGHLVAGSLVGLRFNYIRIGPLRVERSGKMSWQWTWRALLSGATSSLPVARTALRWRLCIFVAGGPAANLVCAFYGFKIMPKDNSMGAAVGMALVGISTLIGFTNLLPIQRDGQMRDGLQIWILLFGKKRRERLIFILTFLADLKRGDSTSFLTSAALEQASSVMDGSGQQVAVSWLAYAKATSAKEYETAALHLENCLITSPATTPDFREEIIIEAAQFQAVRRKRPDLAREWLALERSGKIRLRRFQAEALVLYRENQCEQALAKAEEGLATIESVPEGTKRNVEEEALRNLRDVLQKHRTGEPDRDVMLS